MPPPLAPSNPLYTSPSANLSPEQDALRWRAVMQRITDLENQLRQAVKVGPGGAPGGSQVVVDTLTARQVQIGPSGTSTPAYTTIGTQTDSVGNSTPRVVVPNQFIQLIVQPQLGVYDVRDATPAFTLIGDEQFAFDASLTQRGYSSVSLGSGSTMPNDVFTRLSYAGGLGPGAFVSRRAGLQWGGSGNWGVDFSFICRYHSAPSSITLTTISDSLNGGTKSVTAIDYFGAMVQVLTTAGGGFTLNRWTASGGF